MGATPLDQGLRKECEVAGRCTPQLRAGTPNPAILPWLSGKFAAERTLAQRHTRGSGSRPLPAPLLSPALTAPPRSESHLATCHPADHKNKSRICGRRRQGRRAPGERGLGERGGTGSRQKLWPRLPIGWDPEGSRGRQPEGGGGACMAPRPGPAPARCPTPAPLAPSRGRALRVFKVGWQLTGPDIRERPVHSSGDLSAPLQLS